MKNNLNILFAFIVGISAIAFIIYPFVGFISSVENSRWSNFCDTLNHVWVDKEISINVSGPNQFLYYGGGMAPNGSLGSRCNNPDYTIYNYPKLKLDLIIGGILSIIYFYII